MKNGPLLTRGILAYRSCAMHSSLCSRERSLRPPGGRKPSRPDMMDAYWLCGTLTVTFWLELRPAWSVQVIVTV